MLKQLTIGCLLATSLVSCNEDFKDWANPQSNNPEAAKSITMTVAGVLPIDFAQLKDVDSVVVFKPSVTVAEPTQLSYSINLTPKGDASQTIRLAADTQGRVAVADLRAALEKLYGKAPIARELNAEVVGLANVNGESLKYVGNTPLTATLYAPVIEQAYYLVGDGIGWDLAGAKAHPFLHSSTNVYDDPNFTITVPAPTNADGTRKDFTFNVVPASAIVGDRVNLAAVLGSDQATEAVRATEKLIVGGQKMKQSATDGAKFYSISLNMWDDTRTVTPRSFKEYIYVPGNHQGWSPATAPALRSANFDGVYTGFVHLNGGFKFTLNRDWSQEYNYGSFSIYSPGFADDGGNINATVAGTYFLNVNVPAKRLEATPITKVGVIGGFNSWNGDHELTYNAAEDCYQGQVTLDGGEFKFRFNGDWAINLGGSFDNLTQGGDNLSIAAGTYTVKLYLSRAGNDNIYCTLTK